MFGDVGMAFEHFYLPSLYPLKRYHLFVTYYPRKEVSCKQAGHSLVHVAKL